MQIKDLYRYGQKVTVRRGEIITDAVAGSDEVSVYILDKGLAALTSTNKKGDEFIYLFFRGPRCIGFAPAVTQMLNLRPFPMSMHQPTMFTILAKSDCSLYRISRANFQALMEDPDFSAASLCAESRYGSKQVYRKIKQLTGLSIVEFIRDTRLQKAAQYLSQGKLSVTEVMYKVGFTTASYFSKCFKEKFGVPPSEYK